MESFLSLLIQYPILSAAVAVFLILVGCGIHLHLYGPSGRLGRFLIVVALAVPGNMLAMFAANCAGRVRPYKLDLYVYWIDNRLGFQPSFALGRFVMSHPSMMVLLALSYQLLPIAILAVFGAYLWLRSEREAMSMVPVFILNLALSVPCYLLFPVSGPAYAFPGFPALPGGQVVPHPILLSAPPNGVPSIHFSTALLILWYGWKLPFGRWIAGMYLALIAVSTMASGEHYLFDLLAAVPYTVLVHSLGGYAARLNVSAARVRTHAWGLDVVAAGTDSLHDQVRTLLQ